MRERIQHDVFGEIEYNENFFTGKKSISINGAELEKRSKNMFVYFDGEEHKSVVVVGNYLTGVKIVVGGQKIQIVKPVLWYEIALAVVMFAFFIVWGNVPALCEMFPLVGGAIGGGITGVMAIGALVCMKFVKPVWAKILIWLGFAGATLGINYGVAMAIIGVLT